MTRTNSTLATESRESTGQRAINFLVDNCLEDTPENYKFAHHYFAQTNSVIVSKLTPYILDRERIRQEDVNLILAAAKADANSQDNSAAEALSVRNLVKKITGNIRHVAEHTSEKTRDFSEDLQRHLLEIQSGDGGPDLLRLINNMIETANTAGADLKSAQGRITDLEEDLHRATDMARKDALTGLLNRRVIEQQMEGINASSSSVYVVMADIDHFKSVNDRFGHNVGDRVIKAIGGQMRESMGPATVGRWGGEEFIAIIEGDAEQVRKLCDDTRSDIAARRWKVRETDEPMGSVTVSMGFAKFEPGQTAEEVIAAADALLYKAKHNGRNRVESN